VKNIYYYEGELLPFNQCRVEVRLSDDAESGHGLLHRDSVKSISYTHIVKVETADGKTWY